MIVANAQTFTQRLEQSKTGEGKVTVTQDKTIEDLVNGPKPVPVQQQQPQTTTQKPITSTKVTTTATKPDTGTVSAPNTHANLRQQQPDTTVTTTPEPEVIRKKVMKGYKTNGYRVQVYAGGNSRQARIKAERTGREMNALFPSEPVYVHFYSPRWICRMGNYRTYEQASEVLRAVKKLGYQSAIIVKGKIVVPYTTPSEETEPTP